MNEKRTKEARDAGNDRVIAAEGVRSLQKMGNALPVSGVKMEA